MGVCGAGVGNHTGDDSGRRMSGRDLLPAGRNLGASFGVQGPLERCFAVFHPVFRQQRVPSRPGRMPCLQMRVQGAALVAVDGERGKIALPRTWFHGGRGARAGPGHSHSHSADQGAPVGQDVAIMPPARPQASRIARLHGVGPAPDRKRPQESGASASAAPGVMRRRRSGKDLAWSG